MSIENLNGICRGERDTSISTGRNISRVIEIITGFWADFSRDLASTQQWLHLIYNKHQEKLESK